MPQSYNQTVQTLTDRSSWMHIVLGRVVHHPAASRQLSIYLVSQILLQRVLQKQLLATYDNVKLQGNSVVQHLQFGNSADCGGFLTGVDNYGLTLPVKFGLDIYLGVFVNISHMKLNA